MTDTIKPNASEGLIFLIGIIIGIIIILLIGINFNGIETTSFISECNDLYGEPTWNDSTYKIVKVDEYTSYSHDFWESHPKISVNDDAYTCFEK